ncbi:MAG: hypothetical protein KY442_06765, partial [Proteobacteria bacterium]|nr:hypothetical protein [Pseudomonadota bacterium]
MDSLLKHFSQSSQLGANAAYIEDLYEQYLVSPDSVDGKWKTYFDGLKGREAGDVPHSAVMQSVAAAGRTAASSGAASRGGDERERAVGKLITAYRSRGHLAANMDPLGLIEQLPADALDETSGKETSAGAAGACEQSRLHRPQAPVAEMLERLPVGLRDDQTRFAL